MAKDMRKSKRMLSYFVFHLSLRTVRLLHCIENVNKHLSHKNKRNKSRGQECIFMIEERWFLCIRSANSTLIGFALNFSVMNCTSVWSNPKLINSYAIHHHRFDRFQSLECSKDCSFYFFLQTTNNVLNSISNNCTLHTSLVRAILYEMHCSTWIHCISRQCICVNAKERIWTI